MTDPDSEDQALFGHLIVEFGDRGRDAVGFLETAQRLLVGDVAGDLPRRAGAAAYCVREGLKRLLPPEHGRPSWRRLSNDVLDAKNRLEAVRGLPGGGEAGASDALMSAIERLEEFKRSEQRQHQRRLADLMVTRTGTVPLTNVLSQYQSLLRELDSNAVHSSASVAQVRELLGRAISLLMAVFAPFQLRLPDDGQVRLQVGGQLAPG